MQASVLVVDDDEPTRCVINDMLSTQGYCVTEASNGKEALACLDQLTPDVILLDLAMPVMDGFQFLREHRAHPRRGSIPVIVISGISPHHHRCMEMPIVRFISKPFTEEQLVAAIEAEISSAFSHKS